MNTNRHSFEYFTVILAILVVSSGCATQMTKAPSRADRQVSSAGQSALLHFMESLSSESGVADRAAFETAFMDGVNRDADGLSVSRIRSVEDIRSMSASDQIALIRRLADDPVLKRALSVSDDAVLAARTQAMNLREVPSVAGVAVPDIHGTAALDAMASENAEIQRISGTAVLGEQCNNLQDQEAVQTLRKIVNATHGDVVAGTVKKPEEIANDFEERLSTETGANRRIAHNRRCQLAAPKNGRAGCAILAEALYVGCDAN